MRIEPDVFFDNLVLLPVDGWQVAQEREEAITFLILGRRPGFDQPDFLRRMTTELVKRGATPPTLKVERITELPRTKIGKLVTIRALSRADARSARG